MGVRAILSILVVALVLIVGILYYCFVVLESTSIDIGSVSSEASYSTYLRLSSSLSPSIMSSLNITQESNDLVFISWVETNTSLDLEWVEDQMLSEGFLLVEENESYKDFVKRYASYPDYRSDINGPGLTVNVRIFSNGTIITYLAVKEDQLAITIYYTTSRGYPIPLTMQVLMDTLDILSLGNYTDYIRTGIPTHPDARYIGFVWSSNGLVRSDISGDYVINREVILGGWIYFYHDPWDGWNSYNFKVDDHNYCGPSEVYKGNFYWYGLLRTEHYSIGKHHVYGRSSGCYIYYLLIFLFK